ncbi:MAG: hypothetical protein H5T44_04375 [Thermoplasmatales archaeon]|nr:hypothetical protein [Thermoplasmatales archaeon]
MKKIGAFITSFIVMGISFIGAYVNLSEAPHGFIKADIYFNGNISYVAPFPTTNFLIPFILPHEIYFGRAFQISDIR